MIYALPATDTTTATIDVTAAVRGVIVPGRSPSAEANVPISSVLSRPKVARFSPRNLVYFVDTPHFVMIQSQHVIRAL